MLLTKYDQFRYCILDRADLFIGKSSPTLVLEQYSKYIRAIIQLTYSSRTAVIAYWYNTRFDVVYQVLVSSNTECIPTGTSTYVY